MRFCQDWDNCRQPENTSSPTKHCLSAPPLTSQPASEPRNPHPATSRRRPYPASRLYVVRPPSSGLIIDATTPPSNTLPPCRLRVPPSYISCLIIDLTCRLANLPPAPPSKLIIARSSIHPSPHTEPPPPIATLVPSFLTLAHTERSVSFNTIHSNRLLASSSMSQSGSSLYALGVGGMDYRDEGNKKTVSTAQVFTISVHVPLSLSPVYPSQNPIHIEPTHLSSASTFINVRE